MNMALFPYFAKGEVIKGFGRGSKQLGCPTANYPRSVVETLPEGFPTGVYYGFARVDDGPVYKMVMNIGWCPFYGNKIKSMETHILHDFKEDFYGSQLSVCILGHLRDEMNFTSVDDLIEAIRTDICNANQELMKDKYIRYINEENF